MKTNSSPPCRRRKGSSYWLLFLALLPAWNHGEGAAGTNDHLTLKTTVANVKVYIHDASGAIVYKAKMAIDADGSPRAYGPNNTGLDYTASAGSPGHWWGVVTDSAGKPIIQGPGDPAPGMYISTTSLVRRAHPKTNPMRYADAETVPFYIIPSAVQRLGVRIGDVAFVYNTANGKGCYAIYADAGPARSLGEGSMCLARQLGIKSNPRRGGVSRGVIDYIIFPQSGFGQGTIPTTAQINDIGAKYMKKLGGLSITNSL